MAGKGSRNRVNKFKKYQDNFDGIDWGKQKPKLWLHKVLEETKKRSRILARMDAKRK